MDGDAVCPRPGPLSLESDMQCCTAVLPHPRDTLSHHHTSAIAIVIAIAIAIAADHPIRTALAKLLRTSHPSDIPIHFTFFVQTM